MSAEDVTITITPKVAGLALALIQSKREAVLLGHRYQRLTYTVQGRSVPRHVCRKQGRAKARADAHVRRARRRLIEENTTRPVITKGA